MEIYSKHQFSQSMPNLLRKCGYSMIFDRISKHESFVRTFGRGHYPRFHIYVKENCPDYLHLNLHLDMKKESYSGVSAHSGEYDSDVVKQEYKRIMGVFKGYIRKQGGDESSPPKEEKKGFLSRFFGG